MSSLSGSIARSAAAAAVTTAAATAAAATTAAAVAPAATAVAAPLFARTSLVHGKRPPLEHGAVQRGNRRVCSVAHLHEAEAPRTAGVAILDDLRPDHGPVLGKLDPQVLLGRAEREVAHIQILRHTLTPGRISKPRKQMGTAALAAARPTRRTDSADSSSTSSPPAVAAGARLLAGHSPDLKQGRKLRRVHQEGPGARKRLNVSSSSGSRMGPRPPSK